MESNRGSLRFSDKLLPLFSFFDRLPGSALLHESAPAMGDQDHPNISPQTGPGFLTGTACFRAGCDAHLETGGADAALKEGRDED